MAWALGVEVDAGVGTTVGIGTGRRGSEVGFRHTAKGRGVRVKDWRWGVGGRREGGGRGYKRTLESVREAARKGGGTGGE